MSFQLGTYRWVETQDGSPSLCGAGEGEWMHSSGGAFTESLYIYGEVISEALERGLTSFVSLGLGLGYNELLIYCEAARRQIDRAELEIRSFESDPFLVKAFLAALKERKQGNSEGSGVYQKIFEVFQAHYQFTEAQLCRLRQQMNEARSQGRWEVSPALTEGTDWRRSYHCILYDAFSAKTSPELWEESFLVEFLNQAAQPECLFSTYACTGALKRALKSSGFEVEIRPGFFVKRHSTLGRRRPPSKT